MKLKKCIVEKIKARQVYDSRGNPTVEVQAESGNAIVTAIVPSGASTGVHEALELRDNTKDFFGKGVSKAVSNVNKIIAKKIISMDASDQQAIDNALIELDGTKSKSKLGANAILGVSMACCRLAAQARCRPLYEHIAHIAELNKTNQTVKVRKVCMPVPCLNIINGGVHAGNSLDIQEYMIVPAGAKSFSDAMQMASETYHQLKGAISKKYGKNATNVGDEGGFAPPLSRPDEPLELISDAIEEAGYKNKIHIALDAASSEFFKNGKYAIQGKSVTYHDLTEMYSDMMRKYPIISIEDPFAQDHIEAWAEFTKKFGKKVQIVGDDFLVTNKDRIKQAAKYNACNALLLKLNQIGTVSESISAARLSSSYDWNVMVSHRSGETEDSFIADFAAGLGCKQIKAGAPARSERLAKYNQLLRIEEALKDRGQKSFYPGIKAFRK